MKKKYIYFILLLVAGAMACSDDELDNMPVNYLSAQIDGQEWKAAEAYTQKARGENGPLTIVGEGDGFTLELILGGIDKPGIYQMGTTRSGRIKQGNTTYSTLDVTNAGTIEITRYEKNKVEGNFSFDAQWLSANNRLEVREGKFEVIYY